MAAIRTEGADVSATKTRLNISGNRWKNVSHSQLLKCPSSPRMVIFVACGSPRGSPLLRPQRRSLIAFQFQTTAGAIIRAITADMLFVGF
jgi:hypothetical protein